MNKIYFLSGASGVGKTTIVEELQKQKPDWIFEYFDSIGIPAVEHMIAESGSIEKWQKDATNKWITKLLSENIDKTIIFEGQVNLAFIKEAFIQHNFTAYKIILLHCSADEMQKRLKGRGQADLFTLDMQNWMTFLHNQAHEMEIDIIDTGSYTISELSNILIEKITG